MERLLTATPSLSNSPRMRSAPHRGLSRHPADQVLDVGAQARPTQPGAGPPPPEQAPALPVPADHRLGLDDDEVPAPSGAVSVGEQPQRLVPAAETGPRARGAGQDSQL